jgi:protein-tyrosine phosphatase
MGGCRDDLILPPHIKHLVSLYPWESYRVTHDLDSFTQVKAYDAAVEPLVPILDGLASWVVACLRSGHTLIHCQAGLNRSGLVAALALIKMGRSAKDAIAILREKRSPFVLCNPSFERWLLELDGN